MNLKIFLCLFIFVALVSCEFDYIIIAPKLARIGEKYDFSISTFNTSLKSFDLIYGIRDQDLEEVVSATSNVWTGIEKRLQFKIPKQLEVKDYEFFIFIKNFDIFETRSISIHRKVQSIFIQTDKFLYKPGQKVLFRCIAFGLDLKPFPGIINITIFDQSENKIKKIFNQHNKYGVISDELELSSITPLGIWKILAETQYTSESVNFEVAEYVLPKFQVNILSSPYYFVNEKNLKNQKDFIITIISKYTYGKPVEGEVELEIKMKNYFFDGEQPIIYKNFNLIDGKSDIKISYQELESLLPPDLTSKSLFSNSFSIKAGVTELVTGIVMRSKTSFICDNNPFQLTFSSSSMDNFRPGFAYLGYLELKQKDGSTPPVSALKTETGKFKKLFCQVLFTYDTMYYKQKNETEHLRYQRKEMERNFTFDLNENGFSIATIPTEVNMIEIRMEITYYNAEFSQTCSLFKILNKFETLMKGGFKISLPDQKFFVEPEKKIKFKAETIEPTTSLIYQVIAKGIIVTSGKINIKKPTKILTFDLFISKVIAQQLAPEARFVFGYVSKQRELIADMIVLPVINYLANNISFSFNKNITEPGDNGVVLEVETSPESLVGLLGVDQSVLLLHGGNDLNQEKIKNELNSYSTDGSVVLDPMRRFKRCLGCQGPIWFEGSNSASLLDDAGLSIITNLQLPQLSYLSSESYIATANKAVTGASLEDFLPKEETEVEVRKDFPETFIWTDFISDSEGKYKLKLKVPDTITSWVTSGFSVSPLNGLGVNPFPAKLTVIKPFFISLNLPYSIIRGEEFRLQVSVFNYYGKDLKSEVTLFASKYFKVIDCVTKQPEEKQIQKKTEIHNNKASSIYFWIVATSLGKLPVEVKASAGVAADTMQAEIFVKPEGQTESYSTSQFIQIKSGESYLESFNLTLPSENVLVSGSVTVEVTLIGDLMGSTLNNLDNLLQMPNGCGEQTMLIMAPEVYLLDYLTLSGQLTKEIENKAIHFINSGYQRELTFQRTDGSFSAFGNNDNAGSVWLSAFVIKSFHQARNYIPVEDEKMKNTINWILNFQSPNGSFYEAAGGRVIHTDMQGGSSSGVAMTAYVLISLLENKNNTFIDKIKLNSSLQLATSFLENTYTNFSTDPYALSIISYAFYKAGSSKLPDVLSKLEKLATSEGNFKYWKKKEKVEIDENNSWICPYDKPKSYNIEIASYVLLVYAESDNFNKALPIAKWLLSQRNSFGGFSSTQDTVLGLESLASFASMVGPSSDSKGVSVSIKSDFDQQLRSFKMIIKTCL